MEPGNDLLEKWDFVLKEYENMFSGPHLNDTLGFNMQATEFIFDFVIKKNANFHGCDFQVHGS